MDVRLIKLIHLTGVFGLFLAFGAVIATEPPARVRWQSLLHGIALFVILAAGFALLGALGVHGGLPSWVLGKLAIWFLFGFALIPSKRKLIPRPLLITVLLLLGAGACFLAFWKPGA